MLSAFFKKKLGYLKGGDILPVYNAKRANNPIMIFLCAILIIRKKLLHKRRKNHKNRWLFNSCLDNVEVIFILKALQKIHSAHTENQVFWPGYLLLRYFFYGERFEGIPTEKGKCSGWIDVNTVYLKNNAAFV